MDIRLAYNDSNQSPYESQLSAIAYDMRGYIMGSMEIVTYHPDRPNKGQWAGYVRLHNSKGNNTGYFTSNSYKATISHLTEQAGWKIVSSDI